MIDCKQVWVVLLLFFLSLPEHQTNTLISDLSWSSLAEGPGISIGWAIRGQVLNQNGNGDHLGRGNDILPRYGAEDV